MSDRRGVTLIEMLIVVAIIGVIAGISFPSVAAGLETIQLRSASDSVTGFLNGALSRVERRQEPIEVVVIPQENSLTLFSAEPGYMRKLVLPPGIRIQGTESREFLLLPGGTPPAMNIEIANQHNGRKTIRIDPVTGVPQS